MGKGILGRARARGTPREGPRAHAVVRLAHEAAALQPPDVGARRAVAIEGVETDLVATEPRTDHLPLAPVAFARPGELLVAPIEMQAEFLAPDGDVPRPFHRRGNDPEITLAPFHLDLLVGLPVAQIELVRGDARAGSKLEEAGLQALHHARADVEREDGGD